MHKTTFVLALITISSAITSHHVISYFQSLHRAKRVLAHYRDVGTHTNQPTFLEASLWSWKTLSYLSSYSSRYADTTVVILNWSRFSNVVNITGALCHPALASIVAKIFIWNNSPNQISVKDFNQTGCPTWKFRVHNSPENLYFQARFIACAQAHTPYCFIQDDDYLVLPEVLHALHSRIHDPRSPDQIYLLPAHEHLSSTLREMHAPNNIHTSFAWLGHGTLLRRTLAIEFLTLMKQLNATREEIEMADNYYAVLANRVPEIWFDQGIELGGGQPFTVGTVGDERNKRHIIRATEYLDRLASCTGLSCLDWPYVTLSHNRVTASQHIFNLPPSRMPMRATCAIRSCILETNIKLLPETVAHHGKKASDMPAIEQYNAEQMGELSISHYVAFPPSHVVDGRIGTVFQSPKDARAKEYIALDLLDHTRASTPVEVMLHVGSDMIPILLASSIETSAEGAHWTRRPASWRCAPMQNMTRMEECKASFSAADAFRHIRVLLNDDVARRWAVYEMWVR